MKIVSMLFAAAVLIAGIAPAQAGYGHPVTAAPTAAAKAIIGGSASAGACIVGGLIVGTAIVIVAHEVTRNRCNEINSTYVNSRHDINPKPVKWRDPCKSKRSKRNLVKARG